VRGAQFVAGGIAEIGEIEFAERRFARAGRLLDRGAAIGEAGGMPCLDRLGRTGGEADRAAIGMAGGLAVDRLAQQQPAAA
jgi:hypothetical protein